jgi:ATP-binding cassette, subfamily C (CFTR/MRP), member 1
VILDDTFSGLDNETQDQIFTRLLGPQGLLRKLGTTTLLATHQLHRLQSADQIFVVGDGLIQEQGSLTELRARDGYLSQLLETHQLDRREDQEPEEQRVKLRKEIDPQQTPLDIETLRPLGDLQVYKHYFTAVGWLNTAGFFVMIAAFAFFSRFPGKHPSIPTA